MWNIEPTLTERAKYWYPSVWQREMWQNIYYTSSNIFTTRPFASKIFASPTLCVYPLLSLLPTIGRRCLHQLMYSPFWTLSSIASMSGQSRAGEGGEGAGAGSQQRDEGRLGAGNTESLWCAHPGLLLGLCDGWNYTGKNTFYLVRITLIWHEHVELWILY